MRYITDRKRAQGLGSGRSGTHHHWQMLLSSIGLVLIVPFFVFTFGAGFGGGFEDVTAFFSSPFVAIVTALMLVVGALHFRGEVTEAVEDYVHGVTGKLLIVATSAATYVAIGVGLFALARLAL